MSRASTKILRPARLAVLHCLRHWQEWTERPNHFVDDDAEIRFFLSQQANLSRTPIVATRWLQTNPEWWVFTLQEWRAPLEISVYVPEDRHTLAEDMIEDALDAVYRFEAPTSSAAVPVSYLMEQGICHWDILSVSPANPLQAGIDGRHRLLQSTAVLSLRLKKSPQLLRRSA